MLRDSFTHLISEDFDLQVKGFLTCCTLRVFVINILLSTNQIHLSN